MKLEEAFLAQLDELIAEFEAMRRGPFDDFSQTPVPDVVRFNTRARAAIHRIAGDLSPYAAQCDEIVHKSPASEGWKMGRLGGVVVSLRADLAAGYLESLSELIRGDLFADFLEMADHLAAQSYKDAAAVVAGSALEAHLRALAQKAGVAVESADGRAKKADTVNAELVKAGAYAKLDQKAVLAWLDLRNNAAHGDYDKYTLEQVELLIAGVCDFIRRLPA